MNKEGKKIDTDDKILLHNIVIFYHMKERRRVIFHSFIIVNVEPNLRFRADTDSLGVKKSCYWLMSFFLMEVVQEI